MCESVYVQLPLLPSDDPKARRAAYMRAYRLTHLDQERARDRLRDERAREKRREQHRTFYWKLRDKNLAYQKARRERYPDKKHEADKAYQAANREKVSESKRRYYTSRRHELLARAHDAYWRDPAQKRAYQSRYLKDHPDRDVIHKQRRRAAKLRASVNDLTVSQWREILAYFGHRCAYCGRDGAMTQDHVIALSKGGGHTASNIVPACRSCNSRKHDRPLWVMT